MITLYRILFPIFFTPVILLLSLFSKKIRSGTKQKFGMYNFKCAEKTIWVHAVSVGEVLAIANFIEQNSDEKIVLTTSTPQGQELAKKRLGAVCEQICYFPYDYGFAIKNAIRAINPKMIVIVETEIWPNFVSTVNVPVIIANGRISDKTFKSYRRAKFFFKQIFKNFSAILAQSEEDAKKFIAIGASSDIVQNMGNVKFDIKRPEGEILKKGDYKLIVAGSTHSGEEKIILETFNNLKREIPNLKLIIAPRHLERTGELSDLLKNENFALKTSGETLETKDVIILNTTGELANLYSIADIAIIGGSFNNTGGHNPLEATIWGKPVISGANVKNFRLIYGELLANNCAIIVQDAMKLESELRKLLSDERHYSNICQNCERVILKNQGATTFLSNYIRSN